MTARVLCLVLLGCCLAAVVTAGAAGCEVDTSAGKVLRTTVGMAGVFSTAAVVGDNVFLSGVLGLTNSTTTTQPPVGRQTSLALSRLSHSLDYLFFSFLRCPREEYRRVEEHIYKLTVHVKDAESVAEVEAVIRRFFDTPPAYTIVSAVSLPFGAAVQLDCEVSLRKARKADTEGSTPLSLVRIQDHPPLNRIVTSGTLGTVGTPGGVGAETTQALQNVFAALNRTGEEAVVTQCIVHLRDNDRATFDTMNQAYAAFFPKVVPTRMSLSGVKLHQGAAVQVQCDAVEGGEKTITWGNVAGVAGLPVFSTFARSEPDQVLLLSGILGTLNNTVPFKLASGGITGETQQAMDNIKYSISRVVWGVDSHPAAMDRVAKCIVYLKASDMATVEAMSQVYTSYFSATPPATTLLLNVTLALGASVEVQCVASGQPEPSSWVSTATDIY